VDFSEQYWVMVEKLAPDGVTYRTVGGRTRLTVVPYAIVERDRWFQSLTAPWALRSSQTGLLPSEDRHCMS